MHYLIAKHFMVRISFKIYNMGLLHMFMFTLSLHCVAFLANDMVLGNDQMLMSSNSLYQVRMQNDGNLVLYKGSDAIWWSNTVGQGQSPYKLVMHRADNHMVMYDKDSKVVWGTGAFLGKSFKDGAAQGYAIIQDDGNFVVYDGNGEVMWESQTSGGNKSSKLGSGKAHTGNLEALPQHISVVF